MKKGKRTPRRNYRDQADVLFSKLVRAEGKCAECSSRDRLQCAHLISRSYQTIRTDLGNAVCLCSKHHQYFTHRPLEWERWCEDMFGAHHMRVLREKALTHDKVDWKAELARLKAVAAAEGLAA